MGEGASIAARFAQYFCLLVLFGGAAFGLYAPRAAALWPLRRWLVGMAGGGLVCAVLALMVQAAAMSGLAASAVDPAMLWMTASTTQSGHAWLVRATALVGALFGLAFFKSQPGWTAAFAAVAVATVAWSGHGAQTEGLLGCAHLAVDIAHLLAAGLWVGALLCLAVMVFAIPATDPDQGAGIVEDTLARFAGLGSLLVATLIATGLANTAFLVDRATIIRLPAEPWGRVLLAKLALFLGMTGLAGANRFVLTPRLRRTLADPDARVRAIGGLRLSVLTETGLGLLVLGLVAWLGLLSPPIEG